MRGLVRAAEVFDRAIEFLLLRLALPAATAALAVALLSMAAQVVSRYFFGWSLVWSEEVARYALAWSTMLGAAVAYHKVDNIAVTVLLERFPALARYALTPAIHAASLVFALVLLVEGWAFTARNFARGQMTTALEIPIAWIYLAMPVGGALIAVAAVAGLLRGRPTFQPPRLED